MKLPDERVITAPERAQALEERLAAADRRMLAPQARHRSLIDSLPDVTWTADAAGRS